MKINPLSLRPLNEYSDTWIEEFGGGLIGLNWRLIPYIKAQEIVISERR